MSKPIIPLLIAFLSLWLFGGAYWLSNNLNSEHKIERPIKYNFEIKDGDFEAKSSTIFAFQTSDFNIIINEEQFLVLESLAAYLNRESQKQVRLIAYFGAEESYFGKHPNIGVARAETVKDILIKRGAPETSIQIESEKVEKLVLNENGLISGGIDFDIFDKDISNSITEANFLKEELFYFEKNRYQLPDKKELEIYAADLKQFMVDEKESKLIITGFRDSNESESMALLRAKFVEDIFINHGIDKNRISLESNVENDSKKDKNNKKVEIKVF